MNSNKSQSVNFNQLNVPTNVNFSHLEEETLKFWQQEQIFQKSIANRSKDNEYIFYDGPPFANGLPHYGHILTGYIKDSIPRYFTMQGKRVERRFGWDCHGLPAENGAEKELGLNGKQEIETFGVGKFNAHCRSSVLKYTQIWEESMTRLGRWVDFENDYKTMDIDYMETILWVFKTLYDKDLIYKGNKVLHYCCRCQTPLSNFEAGLDDAYRPKKDLSLTVKMRALDFDAETYFLVWTTTPWTLPSNVAIAVGPELNYFLLKHGNVQYIVEEHALPRYLNELPSEEISIEKTFKGSELIGNKYQPLFPYFADTENAFQIYPAEFVTTSDGTGLVHIAPTFGEDDAQLGKKYSIKAPDPVDAAGCFDESVPDFVGQNVHEVSVEITKFLAAQNLVLKKEKFEHSYPYCWRCDTPLIYRAIPSWYVAVTKIKDKMVACNQKINWIPEHIKNGIFGKWLADARDWAISRNRYFGAPVPVWECNKCSERQVIGSIAELEKLSGHKVTDLHRPHVDEITWQCDKCFGTMHRITEVLDCWFESGSMPYAQLHYPFENKERFQNNFPADFIVEYIAQTRGWFYTLVILAAALFDAPPFKNAIAHGVIFAEDGRKMSKRLMNFADPKLLIDKYGSDALRFYLLSSPVIVGKNINFAESGVSEMVRTTMLPLWNAYRFFVTYAAVDNFSPRDCSKPLSDNYLDRYILSKLEQLLIQVTNMMESYDLNRAAKELTTFLDVLNNTYIRRSRRRFWKSENDQDKEVAYQTLYYVLLTFCQIAAPLLPFLAEHIFKNLSGQESVHLTDWPQANADFIDHKLISEIDRVEQVLSVGRTIRKEAAIKVREPRAKVTLAGIGVMDLVKYQDWILEELNVKKLEIREDLTNLAEKTVKLNLAKLGPKVGKEIQNIIRLNKENNFTELADTNIQIGDTIIDKDDFEFELKMPAGVMQTEDGKIMVAIDMTETPKFKKEGIARDIVRQIQLLRKEADFEVSDRIYLRIEAEDNIAEAIDEFQTYILSETLALTLNDENLHEYDHQQEVDIDGTLIAIAVSRVAKK